MPVDSINGQIFCFFVCGFWQEALHFHKLIKIGTYNIRNISAKIDIYIDTRVILWYNITDCGDKCAHARARTYTREYIATDNVM